MCSGAVARDDPYWERALPHRMTLSWLSVKVLGSEHAVADLGAITCPVLLTKGTHGSKYDRRIVDILGERLPRCRVVELEGSHAHHIESIDAFIAALQQHLTGAS